MRSALEIFDEFNSCGWNLVCALHVRLFKTNKEGSVNVRGLMSHTISDSKRISFRRNLSYTLNYRFGFAPIKIGICAPMQMLLSLNFTLCSALFGKSSMKMMSERSI